MQLLAGAEMERVIGAGSHERTAERTTHRNCYRDPTAGLTIDTFGPHRCPELCRR